MADKLSALKIVPASYGTYLALPKPGRFPTNLPAVNRQFLVYDPELENGPWGLFDELDFRRNYKFLETPSMSAMTPVERVDLQDAEFGPNIGL